MSAAGPANVNENHVAAQRAVCPHGAPRGAAMARGESGRVLCLAGPTGVGKTAVAVAFAQAHAGVQPVEIISVDSALVYRGMDIGTAKPSLAERAAVPHHLIDLIDPAQTYSAAQFVADASRAIREVHSRGHLPLLVGGTMMYFKALREGLHEMPAANAAVRAELDAQAAVQGWPALHAELARVDATTAARLAPNDSQRIQRALEVWRVSGRALSSWHQGSAAGRAAVASGQAEAADPWPLLSLEPQSRTWLHQRLAARYQAMLEAGFVQEVQRLRARGDLHLGLPSMRCVGYRQVWEALDRAGLAAAAPGTPTLGLRSGAPTTAEQLAIAATRQLAKRQLTWLRSITQRRVVFCDEPGAQDLALQVLGQFAVQQGEIKSTRSA